MLYEAKPGGFKPKFESVGCFVEHGGEILLLHRQNHKSQGDTWGLPSGKIENEECPLVAMVREMKEETGCLVPSSQMLFLSKVYVRFQDYDFIYHIFRTRLDERQKVKINHAEHKDFRWVSPNGALGMRLIQDLDACIKLVYGL